jgi:hypothetical protein
MCTHRDALDIIRNLHVSAQPIYPFPIKYEENKQQAENSDRLK